MLPQPLLRGKRGLSPFIVVTKRLYGTNLVDILGPRRALVHKNTGEPRTVLYGASNTQQVHLRPGEVAIKFLLSPINPANLNTVEGTYPSKPILVPGFDEKNGDVFIGGNEGVAEVVKVAPNEQTDTAMLKEGDWVVMRKAQSGTWTNWRVMNASEVLRVPRKPVGSKVTEVFAATMMVNGLTALGLVSGIEPGSHLLQNGANSGVGQAVIQVAKNLNVKTINFVRDREDFSDVEKHLKELGATHIFPYSKLLDRAFKKEFAALRKGSPTKHAFNGIGGATATAMGALLDQDGHLFSYGGMSKEPLKIPVGLQIFRGLTCHGYWHSRVWSSLSQDTQAEWVNRLTSWKENGEFQDPKHEIITLKGDDSAVGDQMREVLDRLQKGMVGSKLLLKWE
ncbi:hypothetical protein M408DRAFT_325691 [Serendipita vermifera MAFF 305830]|uniref:Alcohol dehydrogenase-like C-terminal domain-containing protein n=1 Tax=Serendipita vermifera MAFF 305830 TaxID=933852 RepID=A0A0C3BQ61_SERVB|nr:hypothetical protein M408DRAFT_325691 [Serendipita vermifera MAFF 305830]